jgi:hypothetical protein
VGDQPGVARATNLYRVTPGSNLYEVNGIMGKHNRKLLDAVAEEAVARRGNIAESEGRTETVTRYKSSIVANIHAQPSVALHAGMSGKMLKHISAQVVGHGAAGLTMLQRSGAPRSN